jgi:hypothetical protein
LKKSKCLDQEPAIRNGRGSKPFMEPCLLPSPPFILLQGIEKQFPKLEEDEKTRSVFQRELFLNCGKGFRLSASLLYTFFEKIYQNGDTGIFNKEV